MRCHTIGAARCNLQNQFFRGRKATEDVGVLRSRNEDESDDEAVRDFVRPCREKEMWVKEASVVDEAMGGRCYVCGVGVRSKK